MKQIFKINLLILLFLLGLLLNKAGFPYIQYVSGFIVLIIGGLNISWFFEILVGKGINRITFGLLSILSSLFLYPVISYILIILNHQKVNSLIFLISFFIFWIGSLILLLLALYLYKRKPQTKLQIKNLLKNKYFLIVLAIVVIFQVVNFLLYKFIPEADGYGNLINLDKIVGNGFIPNNFGRILFYILSLGLHYLTDIPFYWLFKVVYPLIASSIFLPFWAIGYEKFKGPWKYLVALMPFMFPVVSMELLCARPQLIFIIFFVFSLYITSKLVKTNNKSIYVSLYLLFLSTIGLKIHEFFVFSTLILLITNLIFLWPVLKKKPIESFIIFIFLIIGVYPWLNNLNLLRQFGHYGAMFYSIIRHPKIHFWFINSYVNTDGSQMGWSGVTALFYYVYNLGIVSILVIITSILRKQKSTLNFGETWPYWLGFGLFFAIAEIFPRIGLAFLPDRAWLFVSLSLAFLVSYFLINIKKMFPVKTSITIVSFLIIISLIFSWTITYLKQGWTTADEYRTAIFIKNNTPENSVILSQPGNLPMIEYFANRKLIVPPKNFFSQNCQIDQQLKEIGLINRNDSGIVVIDPPLYILYSQDKFTNLYGKRAWWRVYNFYGFECSELGQGNYKLVYNINGVAVWKYQP